MCLFIKKMVIQLQTVNVSGTKFQLPSELWVKLKKNIPPRYKDEIHHQNDEIFVARDSRAFQALMYEQLGSELHIPSDMCPSVFRKELAFWGIEDTVLAKCCYVKYMAYFEDQEALKILEDDEQRKAKERLTLENMSCKSGWRGIQGRMWLILNEPFHSNFSRAYFVLLVLLITISIFALVAGTHHSFQRPLSINEWQEYFGDDWNKYKHYFYETIPDSEMENAEDDKTMEIPDQEPTYEPEVETEPEVTSESDTAEESEAEITLIPDTEAVIESGVSTESETAAESEAETTPVPDTEVGTEPEVTSESETAEESEAEITLIADTEAEIESRVSTESETAAESEAETTPVPETEAGTEPQVTSESETAAESEAETTLVPETEAGTEPEVTPESETAAESEAETTLVPETKAGTEPQVTSESETAGESEAETTLVPETEAGTEPDVTSESETAAESEAETTLVPKTEAETEQT